MSAATDIRDVKFCLRKAIEFRSKAKGTTNSNLRFAFLAAARRYDLRAKENAASIVRLNLSRNYSHPPKEHAHLQHGLSAASPASDSAEA